MSFLIQGSNGTGVLRIEPRDSLPQKDIEDNIQANLELFKEWVPLGDTPPPPSPYATAWLIGGGPSLTDAFAVGYLNQGMFDEGSPHHLFLCKHALPYFKSWTVPLACVALDPRPIEGISTHDKKRMDLYASAPKHTIFYLASMTSPSVTKYLLEAGYRVVGWHAASNSLMKFSRETRKVVDRNFHEVTQTGAISITGGTSSLLRTVGLCKMAYGISKFRLLGLDSSLRLSDKEKEYAKDPNSAWRNEKDPVTGAIRRMELTYGVGGKQFWSTGELVAQGQDLRGMLQTQRQFGVDIKIVMTDKHRSLAGAIYDQFQGL